MAGKRGNSEGSIYQRTDGRWVGQLTVEGGRRKYLYGNTRQEVARKLAAALRDRDKGLPTARDERQTLAPYMASWLIIIKPTLRPGAWQRYEQLTRLHILPTLGKTSLARLTAQQFNTLYATKLEEGLSPRTVRYIHVTLHKALGDALELGLVQRNVAALAKPPRKRRREMKTFTPEQARIFLEAVKGDRLEAHYVLAITGGMRLGELLSLRWRDVDLTSGHIAVQRSVRRVEGEWLYFDPKTEQGRRKIALTALALEALRQHRVRQAAERLAVGPAWQENGLVFTDEIGQQLRDTTVYTNRFLPICRRAGLPLIRFHDLRHTAATLMLLQGVNPKVVSEMLGHASVTITLSLYAHVLPDMQKDAAAALDRLLQA